MLIVVQLYPGNYFKHNSAGAMVQGISLSFCPKTDSKGFPIFVERCYFYYTICLFFVLLFELGTVFGVDILLFLSCI
jgi:hypothetical protein